MRRFSHFAALGYLALLSCGQASTITPVGVLYIGEESTIEVPFHNESANTVSVNDAETSCECLVPQFTTTEIPAGETRMLRFSYRSSAVGRMRVDIQFTDASGSPRLPQQSVAGMVVARERFLTAGQLKDLLITGDPVLVDLRRLDRFEAVRLPRSLNLPEFALRHRADLKSRHLVLIDEGFSPATLAELAETLRKNGFGSVHVFESGIAGWIRAGGQVEGPDGSAHSAARITPAEFLRFEATDHWHVVNSKLADSQTPPASERTGDLGRVAPRVLLVAQGDSEYAAIEARYPADPDLRVFYLAGGEKALASYHIAQTRMASNPGAVFQSKSTQPHVVANSGCGTCPK